MQQSWHDIYYTARDGLRLYARHYPAPGSRRRPVLCLAGLTRNARDFHVLAERLSSPENATRRDVYAIDYRGRGRSAHDADWRNYALQVELADTLDFLTLTGLADVAVLGTSRGGLLAMIMGCQRPSAIGACILNDIGPVIGQEGLLRITAYVGRMPLPASWSEAEDLVRNLNRQQFPAVPEQQWQAVARQWYNDEHGRPMHGYDQALGKAVTVLDGPLPEFWPQFMSLARVPTLVLRGEFSDILSVATVAEMGRRHPRLTAATIRGQGHAPLLLDRPAEAVISDFLARTDH